MAKPGLKIYPKRLPPDIRKIIYEMQSQVKNDCMCQFSQEQTIYKLIRIASKTDTNE